MAQWKRQRGGWKLELGPLVLEVMHGGGTRWPQCWLLPHHCISPLEGKDGPYVARLEPSMSHAEMRDAALEHARKWTAEIAPTLEALAPSPVRRRADAL